MTFITKNEALQSVFDKPLMCVIVVVQLQQSKYPRRGAEGASACGTFTSDGNMWFICQFYTSCDSDVFDKEGLVLSRHLSAGIVALFQI